MITNFSLPLVSVFSFRLPFLFVGSKTTTPVLLRDGRSNVLESCFVFFFFLYISEIKCFEDRSKLMYKFENLEQYV